jgi:hypothetical protein
VWTEVKFSFCDHENGSANILRSAVTNADFRSIRTKSMSTGELFRTQRDTSVIVVDLFFFADFREKNYSTEYKCT